MIEKWKNWSLIQMRMQISTKISSNVFSKGSSVTKISYTFILNIFSNPILIIMSKKPYLSMLNK